MLPSHLKTDGVEVLSPKLTGVKGRFLTRSKELWMRHSNALKLFISLNSSSGSALECPTYGAKQQVFDHALGVSSLCLGNKDSSG